MQLVLSRSLSLADRRKEQSLHIGIFLIYIHFANSIHSPLLLNSHQLLQILIFFTRDFCEGPSHIVYTDLLFNP